jgi:hypothetical protein
VKKIKEIRKRASFSKRQDGSEDEFIQQGNFVMEQQLKMIIMRDKMRTINNIHRVKETTVLTSSKRSSSCNSKA